MASIRSNKMSLTAILFLLLSFLNITFAAPIANDGSVARFADDSDLITRGMPDDSAIPRISQQQYEDYLKKYYSQYFKDGIVFYTGYSDEQAQKFVQANPGKFISYYDAFETYYPTGKDNPNHNWYKAFGDLGLQDDAAAASRALAKVSSGNRRVFGGIDYEKYESFYKSDESPILKKTGAGSSISHMIKDTKDPNGVMATEDNSTPGKFTFKQGFSASTKNASAACKKRGGCGGPPTLKPKQNVKTPPPSSPACKRAGSCPGKTPYGPTAEQTGPGGAEPATNDPAHPVTTAPKPPPETTDPIHGPTVVEPEIHI